MSDNNTNPSTENPFDEFSSKIKRLYIPLPNYQFFHHHTTPEEEDIHFVGRKTIVALLKGWLNPDGNPHGVYLITGSRGMGKTSVVGKAITEVVTEFYKSKKDKNRKKWARIFDNICLVCSFLLVQLLVVGMDLFEKHLWWLCMIIGPMVLYLIVRICQRWRRKYILNISVSVGDEINNERDVLAVIADAIRTTFNEHLMTEYPHSSASLVRKLISFTGIAVFLFLIYSLFDGDIVMRKLGLDMITSSSWIAKPAIKWLGGLVLAFVLYLIAKRVVRMVLSNLGPGYKWISAREVAQKLEHCCDRINTTMGTEVETKGVLSFLKNTLSLRHRHYKDYPFATVREIESELIQILRIMNDSRLVRSRLIIVVDELDKLVIQSNKINTKTPDIPEFSYAASGFPGGGSYRVKKQNLLYMLGQLKTFLSNAEAKFIFIAGRELYDSYKEDADREYSIYMFDKILNVDSFFTYDNPTKDVTRMTERYLCKQLLTDGVILEDGNADNIKQLQLSKYYEQLQTDDPGSEKENIRTIVFLRHFVTYLAFVSNGAPKKITNRFERFVITKGQYDKQNKSDSITIGKPNGKIPYYLVFGHYDQQKINFINYMVNPVFRSVISPASEYGDKHLVAASFMLGHIFKHHNGGFSMQNLEYIPELIESTKTPELREFLNAIISLLTQIHIGKITTGLYEYKFSMKIYEEIAFFAKRSELISGIFNFSRDYSLAVKQYFTEVIAHHTKSKHHSVLALANLHLYLGDLHMDSEEYSEAISHFSTTKNLILSAINDEAKTNEPTATLVVRLTRAMLKIGMAYEKRNTLDLAYLTYCELVTRLVSNRFFDESKFGLDSRLEKGGSWEGNRMLIFPRSSAPWHYSPGPSDPFTQIRPPFVDDAELPYAKWSYNSELTGKLTNHLTKESSALISKISIYEDLRVAYTPLLAKLFSIEKQNVGGITLSDIAFTEAEFRHLFLFTNSKEKFILSADFFRKLGDILYYKNSDFKRDKNKLYTLFDMWDYDLVKDVEDYCQNKGISHQDTRRLIKGIKDIIIDKNDIKEVKIIANKSKRLSVWYKNKLSCANDYELKKEVAAFCKSDFNQLKNEDAVKKVPDMISCYSRQGRACHACKYYDRSLSILLKGILYDEERKKLKSLSKGIVFLIQARFNERLHLREKELSQIALSLEAMGNVQLSCHDKKDYLHSAFLALISNLYDGSHLNRRKWINVMIRRQTNTLEKSFAYFLAAAEYYEKLGDTKSMAQCISKIMHMVWALMPFERYVIKENTVESDFIKMLCDRFFPRAARGIQSSYDCFPLHENPEFKNEKRNVVLPNKDVPLDITSDSPDLEELALNFSQILISLEFHAKSICDDELRRIYESMSLTYKRLDSLSYNRIRSLSFKCRLNKLVLRRLFENKGKGKVFNKNFKANYTIMFNELVNDGYAAQQAQQLYNILKKTCDTGLQLLEFLIADSIFCLSNIVEYITPTFRTTLFTNSFYGDTYISLLEWVKLKELYEEWLRNKDEEESKNKNEETCKYEKSGKFTEYFKVRVNDSAIDFLHKTYLGEMALKYYQKSMEINTEGRAYQDFMTGMTIADDDLQNDTCQFYLALERFSIRSGNTQRKINEVRLFAKDEESLSESPCYTFDRYWGRGS